VRNGFLFIILILCFSTLFAQKKDITVWHSYRGSEQTALNQLKDSFNASQDRYRVVLLAIPYSAFPDKLTTAIPNGNGPDAFIIAHERTGDWAESSVIRKLDEGYLAKIKETMIPSTVEAFKYSGSYWGVPLSFKSLVMFYRTDMIKEPPADTDAMIALAKKFTDHSSGRYGLGLEATSVYYAAPFITGFNGGFCLENGGKTDEACIDNEGNRKALSFISDLVNVHAIVPTEATSVLITQLFNNGSIPMVINGPWFSGEINSGVPYSVAVLPVVSETGNVMKPFLTVDGYFFSGHKSADIEGAKVFGDFIISNESAKVRAVTGRQAVSTRSVYDDPDVASDKLLNIFKKQAEISVPMSNLPQMRVVWEPMAKALRKVLRNSTDAGSALKAAAVEYELFRKPLPPRQSPFVYILILLTAAVAGLYFLIKGMKKAQFFFFLKKEPAPYLYLIPAILSMIVLVFVPFAVGTATAFFAHKAGSWTFVGFANFFNILFGGDFPITSPMNFYFTLAVTVLWTAMNVFLHVTLGLSLALLLREPWLKMKGIYRVLLIIPWAVPNYITALIWKGMFNRQFGAINGILSTLGLEPVSWFSSFWTSFAANLTTNTWLGFPFMMVTALGALQAIPGELEDAASVDGAGMFQRFFNITLPLLKPALVPAVILGSVWTFNMFNIIYLVSGGEPDGSTEILISEAYKWAFQRQERYGYAAAYAILIFIVLLFYSKFTEKIGKGAE